MELHKFEKILSNKRILVTGHTGFTGSWLSQWLVNIGSDVYGFSLNPITNPSLFYLLNLDKKLNSFIGDINDLKKLRNYVNEIKPDLIIHLAAQPLVTESYIDPINTFATNAMGTANLLEVARNTESVQAVLCITTDKVYENNEDDEAYDESARLGGKDPYSASKSAAELIIDSYKYSFNDPQNEILIASARGGNIIGGGDWSADRLIPDIVRAITSENTLQIRYPESTRPWQHVLGLVFGYLLLSAELLQSKKQFASAWNFGPADSKSFSVLEILNLAFAQWSKPKYEIIEPSFSEAKLLRLDSNKAREVLNWVPPWDTKKTIEETFNWYKNFYNNNQSAEEITNSQIESWRSSINLNK